MQKTVRVQPRRSLLGNAFGGVILGTAPVFAVAYWFTSSRNGIEVVAIANALVVVFALALVWRQLTVFCATTTTELIGNGIFTPLVRVPYTEIRQVQLIPTYIGAAPEPVLQLLVTGEHNQRLFRTRGNYWSEEDILALASALPVRTERVAEPLSMRDFFRTYPGSAYWFEHPVWLKAVLIMLAAVAGTALAAWVLLALGLPVRFV